MLKHLVIFAVLGTLLLGWPCVAEQKHGKSHTSQDQSGQPEWPIPPTHVVIDPPVPSVSASQVKPGDRQEQPPNRPLPWFLRPEWVIVYITAIYVGISWFTLLAIKRQADLMQNQTKIAAEGATMTRKGLKAAFLSSRAAQHSAKAALEQIRMVKQKESARIRANFPEQIKYLETGWLDFNWGAIEIENVGLTHAFNVKAYTRAEITDSEIAPELKLISPMRFPTVLRSGSDPQKLAIFFETQWEEREITDLSKPGLYLHLLGSIDYEDVFGDAHKTTFRYFMKIDRLGSVDSSTGKSAISSHSGWRPANRDPEDNQAT